jgi:hypothetical protein
MGMLMLYLDAGRADLQNFFERRSDLLLLKLYSAAAWTSESL